MTAALPSLTAAKPDSHRSGTHASLIAMQIGVRKVDERHEA
jgi:hypothetical protein